jgi:uncharacterized membrane protein
LYDRIEDARDAVQELIDHGFSREDISLVAADERGKIQETTATDMGDEDVASGAATGAGIGAVLGGLGGLLVGLGALAIPGIGPVLAAGPLVAALAGAGIGAAAGGLVGALADLGIPDEQAEKYAEGVRRGGTLVTVSASEDMAGQAVSIMNSHNPVDIQQRYESWNATTGFTGEESRPAGSDYQRVTDVDRSRDLHEGEPFEVVEEEPRSPTYTGDTGMDQWELMWRNDYQTNYSHMGHSYEDFRPAYTYGYTLANDPRYREQDWDQIESSARRDWEAQYRDSAWEDFKDAVRSAWMSVRNRL